MMEYYITRRTNWIYMCQDRAQKQCWRKTALMVSQWHISCLSQARTFNYRHETLLHFPTATGSILDVGWSVSLSPGRDDVAGLQCTYSIDHEINLCFLNHPDLGTATDPDLTATWNGLTLTATKKGQAAGGRKRILEAGKAFGKTNLYDNLKGR